MQPRSVQDYTREEKLELVARIDRALPRCPDKYVPKLISLKAECHRHLDSLVSADELYRECAEILLRQGPVHPKDLDKARILLEAATVAKARVQTDQQIQRAVSYLKAIQDNEIAPLRVLGTLTELYAILGDHANYEKYLNWVTSYRESQPYIRDTHVLALDEALERARGHFERRRPSQTD